VVVCDGLSDERVLSELAESPSAVGTVAVGTRGKLLFEKCIEMTLDQRSAMYVLNACKRHHEGLSLETFEQMINAPFCTIPIPPYTAPTVLPVYDEALAYMNSCASGNAAQVAIDM